MKNENLRTLHTEVRNLLRSIPKYILEYIPRARNARADELSNFAMDNMQNTSTIVAGTAVVPPSSILSNIPPVILVERNSANIESAVGSPSIPVSGTEVPESESIASKGLGSVDIEYTEQDVEGDSDHMELEGERGIHVDGMIRITIPESDVVRNDDQTVTVTIAISQLKSLLTMDASKDAKLITEKNSKSVQTATSSTEKSLEKIAPKVRKSSPRKVSDTVAKNSTRKTTVKKTDEKSITLSVRSPSEKIKKALKTESKKIEISL